jgi:alkylation response protein AidB-like acyl-CoA dehydrogenase
MGPDMSDVLAAVVAAGGIDDPVLRQRLASLYIESEVLRLIRLRSISAAIRGEAPGPEASVRKVLADEHGQALMGFMKDLCGASGMVVDGRPLGGDPGMWHFGWLFSQALTIGGGTGDVQRNILAERALGLPHDVDVEAGAAWSEAASSRRLASAQTTGNDAPHG